MGRRAAPADPSSSGLIRLGAVVPPLIGRRLLSLLALLTGSLVLVTASLPASAQTVSQRIKSRSAKETGDQARMLVEAQELVYNEKTNTVEARGDVQINYQGRLLEADRVIYNRTTNRVYAEGHARLTEADGTVLRADRFDFTEDFKNGFVEKSARHRFQSHLFQLAAGRAQRRRDNDLRKRHLHRLRAVQGQSRSSAALAGSRQAHHP